MNGAEAPENRVRVLRRAWTFFSGVVLQGQVSVRLAA
jgi:hypothetical protein